MCSRASASDGGTLFRSTCRRWPTWRRTPTVRQGAVLRGRGGAVERQLGRVLWWHDLRAEASAVCPAEPLPSETPLFVLYTSGSTGKPKGILHTTAGYNLYVKKT